MGTSRRARVRRLALVAVVLTTLAAGAVGVASWELAEGIVHPPREVGTETPLHRGLAYERVGLRTEDGLVLSAWFLPAPDPKGAVVFLHGYGASKWQGLAVAPFLHDAGYQVLLFDFRAHGESQGRYTTVGLDEAKDVRAAVAYLEERADVNASRIALFGWSMGAAAALHAAVELDNLSAVVVDSPFATLEGVVARHLEARTGLPMAPFGVLGLLMATWMTQHEIEENRPVVWASRGEQPLLVIHGLKDALVGPDSGEAIAEAAGNRSELWLVPDARHVDARHEDFAAYRARVVAFLDAHVARLAPACGNAQVAADPDDPACDAPPGASSWPSSPWSRSLAPSPTPASSPT